MAKRNIVPKKKFTDRFSKEYRNATSEQRKKWYEKREYLPQKKHSKRIVRALIKERKLPFLIEPIPYLDQEIEYNLDEYHIKEWVDTSEWNGKGKVK